MYRVREPDVLDGHGPLPVEAKLRFRYPDPQQDEVKVSQDPRFDAEALFFASGRLYILTKARRGVRTTLYRFPVTASTDVMTLERLGDLDLRAYKKQKSDPVTGADASLDGSRLAILTYERIFVYRFHEGAFGPRLALLALPKIDGFEAIAFDRDSIIVGSEEGLIHRIPLGHAATAYDAETTEARCVAPFCRTEVLGHEASEIGAPDFIPR